MKTYTKGILMLILSIVLTTAALSLTAFAETETVTATIPVSVTAEGEEGTLDSDIPTEEYTFLLSAVDEAPLPEETTLTISGSGSAGFAITFTQVGIYQYTVVQDASALTGENSTCNGRGSYDSTVYYVVITVMNAEEGLGFDITVAAHEGDLTGSKPDCLTFTNTYAPVPYDTLTVEKTWTDNSQTRPDAIEVQLLDGEDVVETVTLSAEEDWTYTWTTLDPYASHDWNVVEVAIDGYTPEYTVSDGLVTIHNVGDITTGTLAQTGQLVWPIALFCLLGLCFVVAGVRLMQDDRKKLN